jgi:endonuclease-3
MLIATILSQNTNDRNSYRAYAELRRRFPTWQHVAAAPLTDVRAAIRVGGMARQKAVRIKETLAAVRRRYGRFDLSALRRKSNEQVMAELTSLNGVGSKTASCVLLFSFGRDVFPVDTHIHRICTRLGLVKGAATPEKTYEQMKPLVPKGKSYSFHTNLIRFGRAICRSAHPRCDVCPLFEECVYEQKSRQARSSAANTDYTFMLLDNVR